MYRVDRFYRYKKHGPIILDEKKYLKYMVPYARIINDPAIVLNKDGSMQTTFEYRGPDLESSILEQLGVITAQLNSTFQLLGTGWALYFEAQRISSTAYPKDVYFPDPLTKKIDDIRKKWFQQGCHYESNYYFTLYWMPPSDQEGKFTDFIIEGSKKQSLKVDKHINTFMDNVDRVYRIFRDLKIPVRYMDQDDMATYLHSTLSENKQRIHLPERPVLLDSLLMDSPFSCATDPILGKHHVRMVVPLSFPTISQFGMFNELNKLDFPYRWVTRYYCLNKGDSLKVLRESHRGWRGKMKSMMTTIKELIFGPSQTYQINENAMMKADEVKVAINMVEADEVNYGFYSVMIDVMDQDLDTVNERVKVIEDVFSNMSLRVQSEDLNAGDAWFASMPGNVNHHVRRPLLSTGNLVHMMPISDIWAGKERNAHLKAPALLYTQTEGNTPFRLNLHVGDVGHTLVIGPTGAGKSVLLNSISAQFRKYKDAQVFIFDKGSSSRILTEGVGGKFFDLGNEGKNLSFQPLSQIADEKEREWVQGWLCDYLSREKVTVTPDVKKFIWTALEAMKNMEPEFLTILTLISNVQNEQLRDALSPLSASGPHGSIFDSNKDTLSFASWQTFEMEKLMNSSQQEGNIVSSILMYIFHRIEQQLTGRPTIIVLDECWVFFDNPMFAGKIREWLKVLRKANTAVIFATQSLDDVVKSPIFSTVLESCPSKIFLPNNNALEKERKEAYRSFGLNDRQIEIIARAIPKRQYYYISPEEGSRLFDLALSRYELSFFGVNKADLLECQRLLDLYGQEGFLEQWEVYKNLKEFDVA